MSAAPAVARRLTQRLVLLGVVDVAVGAVLARRGGTEALRAAGTQTALWGAVDLGIAGVGALRRTPPTTARLRRVLLVNAGLDVGYVVVGGLLAGRRPRLGGRLTPDAARGHGAAVVVQGLALLALDLAHVRALRLSR